MREMKDNRKRLQEGMGKTFGRSRKKISKVNGKPGHCMGNKCWNGEIC